MLVTHLTVPRSPFPLPRLVHPLFAPRVLRVTLRCRTTVAVAVPFGCSRFALPVVVTRGFVAFGSALDFTVAGLRFPLRLLPLIAVWLHPLRSPCDSRDYCGCYLYEHYLVIPHRFGWLRYARYVAGYTTTLFVITHVTVVTFAVDAFGYALPGSPATRTHAFCGCCTPPTCPVLTPHAVVDTVPYMYPRLRVGWLFIIVVPILLTVGSAFGCGYTHDYGTTVRVVIHTGYTPAVLVTHTVVPGYHTPRIFAFVLLLVTFTHIYTFCCSAVYVYTRLLRWFGYCARLHARYRARFTRCTPVYLTHVTDYTFCTARLRGLTHTHVTRLRSVGCRYGYVWLVYRITRSTLRCGAYATFADRDAFSLFTAPHIYRLFVVAHAPHVDTVTFPHVCLYLPTPAFDDAVHVHAFTVCGSVYTLPARLHTDATPCRLLFYPTHTPVGSPILFRAWIHTVDSTVWIGCWLRLLHRDYTAFCIYSCDSFALIQHVHYTFTRPRVRLVTLQHTRLHTRCRSRLLRFCRYRLRLITFILDARYHGCRCTQHVYGYFAFSDSSYPTYRTCGYARFGFVLHFTTLGLRLRYTHTFRITHFMRLHGLFATFCCLHVVTFFLVYRCVYPTFTTRTATHTATIPHTLPARYLFTYAR